MPSSSIASCLVLVAKMALAVSRIICACLGVLRAIGLGVFPAFLALLRADVRRFLAFVAFGITELVFSIVLVMYINVPCFWYSSQLSWVNCLLCMFINMCIVGFNSKRITKQRKVLEVCKNTKQTQSTSQSW